MSLLDDVEKLKKAALPEVRETIADKISKYFNDGVFDETEKNIACDIISLLAKDVENNVRQRLAENLKNNSDVPHSVIVALAKDKEDGVCLPILQFSEVLTDDDLMAVLESTKKVARLLAISKRAHISIRVSDGLIKTSNDDVIASLLGNKGSEVSEKSMNDLIAEFNKSEKVMGTLIDRGELPIGIVEKILFAVSSEMKEQLTKKHNISAKLAKEVSEQTREEATIALINEEDSLGLKTTQEEIVLKYDEENKKNNLSVAVKNKIVKADQLVNHLYNQGRLTHSIVIRSLCEGNLTFFESGISRLAGVPTMNARKLIRDENKNAFEALCRRAKIPVSILAALNVMVIFVLKEEEAGTLGDEGFKDRLMEHIVSNEYDKKVTLMPYLMALIGSKLTTNDIIN